MIIDFHSHILPKMDDGASDLNESLKMLEAEETNGVDTVILTPHFYRDKESAESFLNRRFKSFVTLYNATREGCYPKLVLGAEVLFTPSLVELDLKDFCLGDTDYMLLELPYQKLDHRMLMNIRRFINEADVNIIIAHIERYLKFTDEESIMEIMSMNVLSQVNCDSFLKRSLKRKKLLKWIDSGLVHFLGTDAHNTTNRPVNMKEAYSYIKSKLKQVYLMENAESILNNEDIF